MSNTSRSSRVPLSFGSSRRSVPAGSRSSNYGATIQRSAGIDSPLWDSQRRDFERRARISTAKNVGAVGLGALGGFGLKMFLPALMSAFSRGNSITDTAGVNAQSASSAGFGSWFANLFNGRQSSTASTLLGTLGSIGSDLISNDINMKNIRALINEQNEYNTPANQMQRFKDAGLNPNLVYGMGSNGNQVSSGTPVPLDFGSSIMNKLSGFSQIKLASAQADELEQKAIAQKNLNSAWDIQRLQISETLTETQTRIKSMVNAMENDNKRLENEIKQTTNDTERLALEKRKQDNEDAMQKYLKLQSLTTSALNRFNMQGNIGKNISGIPNTLEQLVRGVMDLENFDENSLDDLINSLGFE